MKNLGVFFSFFAVFAFVVLFGCATQKMEKTGPISGKAYDCRKPSEAAEYDKECAIDRRDKCMQELPALSESDRRLIKEGRIYIGMTDGAVRCAYGKPEDIIRSESPNGVFEQWVYGPGEDPGAVYLYFQDGILLSSHN
ncbi:MAG TPA: hypothetical protein DCL35_05755 [Candidatus Omnitrophica bacterium]|nr:hypothetical protein [Candidatus Omnitrophota bacterium]